MADRGAHQSGCLPQGQVVHVRATSEPSYTSTIVRLALTYAQDDGCPSTAPTRLFLKLSRSDSKQRVVGSRQRRHEVRVSQQSGRVYARVHPSYAATRPSTAKRPAPPTCCLTTFPNHISRPSPRFRRRCAKPKKPWTPLPSSTPSGGTIPRLARSMHFRVKSRLQSTWPIPASTYGPFADALGDRLTGPQRQVYERTLASLPSLWERVLPGKDLTLIHGDANFSNVLLPRDPDRDRALIIDWQLWGISFATMDLSHLIALFWDREHRQRMEKHLLMRYHQALIRHGVEGYEWADCWEDYRLAVLLRVLFMPMWFRLSGSPDALWKRSLERAMQAVEDLGCLDLLEG